MSAKYNVVSRVNPRDLTAPRKFYPSYKSSGRITMRQLSKRIAQVSTVSPGDTAAVIETLLEIIPQLLEDGNIVELGALGSFRLAIKTEGSATEAEVSVNNIIKVTPRFTPSRELKEAVANARFEKDA